MQKVADELIVLAVWYLTGSDKYVLAMLTYGLLVFWCNDSMCNVLNDVIELECSLFVMHVMELLVCVLLFKYIFQ